MYVCCAESASLRCRIDKKCQKIICALDCALGSGRQNKARRPWRTRWSPYTHMHTPHTHTHTHAQIDWNYVHTIYPYTHTHSERTVCQIFLCVAAPDAMEWNRMSERTNERTNVWMTDCSGLRWLRAAGDLAMTNNNNARHEYCMLC